MTRAVVLDPGHGGMGPQGYVTPGKRYVFVAPNGTRTPIYEGERMRVLAHYLATELLDHDVEVFTSLGGHRILAGPPHGGPADFPYMDVGLSSRVAFTNSIRGGDGRRPLYLSLHSNAISKESEGAGQGRARGISVYTSTGQTESDKAATAIWTALSEGSKVGHLLPMRAQTKPDGDPDYEENFYVLRTTRGPAVLVELGFHDHPGDATWLLDDRNLREAARYLARGVVAWGTT